MIFYLVIAVFIIATGIIAGSIMVTVQLKSTYQSPIFSSLLFFLAFYYTFGFYTLWGQHLTMSLIDANLNEELLKNITDIMVVLGSPFIMFAAIMFIKFTRELSGRQLSDRAIVLCIFIGVIIVIALGYALISYQKLPSKLMIRYYYIFLMIIFISIGTMNLLMIHRNSSKMNVTDLRKMAVGLVILLVLQLLTIRFYSNHFIFSQLFILFYFLFGGFIPLFLKYWADLSRLNRSIDQMGAIEDFFQSYSISPREKEIIFEINKGLTNQEIADRLYISLQTVKDHTSRIYSKTNCTGRAQLMTIINEIEVNNVVKG